MKRVLGDVHRHVPDFAACEADDLQQVTIRAAHLSNALRFSDFALQKLQLEPGDGYELEEATMEIL